jgi:hypothetical protein
VISSPLQEAIKRLGFAEEDFRHESSSGLAVSRSSNMIGADHRNSIILFPLFHGTSSVFLPSVRTHGLGGKNIVEDWRILDFLRAGMAIIDGHIDRTDPTIEVQWKILQAAASQRVDRMNWRHGATYLIAAQFRAVMYATSSAYGSEITVLWVGCLSTARWRAGQHSMQRL